MDIGWMLTLDGLIVNLACLSKVDLWRAKEAPASKGEPVRFKNL
jgi:hypothetical protein